MNKICREIEAAIPPEDDSEARSILASGHPIAICRPDTPRGFVIMVYPDGREELVEIIL